jgi:hypothetical protein
MVGDAGNSDELIVLFGLGQNLDKYRNTAAVDVDISLRLQQDICLHPDYRHFCKLRSGKARKRPLYHPGCPIALRNRVVQA